jgi:hypothetical protein
MNPAWAIDWGRFIDIDIRKYDGTNAERRRRLQFSYRIDTSLVHPLGNLPPTVVGDKPHSLSERNLIRGWRLRLPSGQDVARAMRIAPLADEDIKIGKAIEARGRASRDIASIAPVFRNNCPLWVYILAEAMQYQEAVHIPVKEDQTIMTPRLGPVGGRIVAEVFLGLMFGDKNSLLNLAPNWQPESGPVYCLKDFVSYALGH